MKKTLFSLLFSAALLFTALPALGVKAEETTQAQVETGSFQVEVEESIISAPADMQQKPAAEFNAGALKTYSKAITISGSTYVFAEIDVDKDGTYFSIFDANGKALSSSSSTTTYNNTLKCIAFKLDIFGDSKNLMIAAYNSKQELIAAKNVTVFPTVWKGSLNQSAIKTASESTSYSASVYLPIELSGRDISVGLYDGNTQVGIVELRNERTSSYVYVGSLLSSDYGYGIPVAQSQVSYNGYIYTSRKLIHGWTYTVKAIVGNTEYNLGELKADGNPYVSWASANADYQGKKPVISVNAFGYDFNGLGVELRDSGSGAVVATSAGGKMLKTSKSYAYYQLATNKTLDELRGARIYVLANGQAIYQGNSFSVLSGIADAYYDHVANTVVARTFGIPDGTLVIASREEGGYTAQGTVYGDAVSFTFYKNGAPAKLPNGSNTISYSYTIPGKEPDTDSDSVRVYNQEDAGGSSVNSLADSFFYVGQLLPIDLTLSKSEVNVTSGNFTAVLKNTSGQQVGSELILSAQEVLQNGIACWKLTGSFPAVAAGNYTLEFKRGTTSIGDTYAVYVMDANKVYGRIYSISWTDGSRGAEIYIPYGLTRADGSERYVRDLFALQITDVMGNNTGINVTRRSDSSNSYLYYNFGNVAEDLVNVRVSATYNGQPVYDISDIAGNKVYSTTLNPNSSNFSVSYSSRTENGCRYAVSVKPAKEAVAYVVQVGTMNVVKTWELPANVSTPFTADMLYGLSYDNAAEAYNIYFYEKNGTGVSSLTSVYLGTPRESGAVTNGIGYVNGSYYLFQDGVINTAYTGLYHWNDKWVYIAAGKVDFSYTGLVLYNSTWFYVSGGYVDFAYTGLICDSNLGWWYVENGVINFNYIGLKSNDYGWWCIEGGTINFGYTGLVWDPAVGWWYVENGAINFGYTGLKMNEFSWWFVDRGAINFSYTGLVWDPVVGWWYVENGAINFSYTGLKSNELGWWFVDRGAINFSYTGLVCDQAVGWWYVQGGAIDFGYIGLAQNEFGWWYVQGGTINFGYTGVVQGPDGVDYNVVNGAVVF